MRLVEPLIGGVFLDEFTDSTYSSAIMNILVMTTRPNFTIRSLAGSFLGLALSLGMTTGCGAGADQAELNAACQRLADSTALWADACGAQLPHAIECAAESDEDVDKINKCAAELDVAECDGAGLGTCAQL